MPKAIIPEGLEGFVQEWKMSPGLEHNGFVFLTGVTGADADGNLSSDTIVQIEAVFKKVESVLNTAGLDFSHVVEMTSYHIGLRAHLEDFRRIRAQYVVEPFPAWTAIEVVGFTREGAVVELRCIARRS